MFHLALVGSRNKRPSSQSVASSGTCESPATTVSVIGSSIPNCSGGNGAAAPATTSPPTEVPINVDNDDLMDDADDEEQARLSGKRYKKCTLWVWQYFKKLEYIEVEGKQIEEIWGYCNFSSCNERYRAEGVCGTTAFKNHLKSKHSTVKGQQQLKFGKNPGSENAHVQPFKYDQEVSLKKLNLAITIHEYPFNIVEHEYLVDFIKSLHPSFPIKFCVSVRKEIMNIYLEEKETLYAHLKI
jgi:hypothetical protein